MPVNIKIKQNRRELVNNAGIVFPHNTRPHILLVTCQKLVELGWDVLSHPSYSPDLAITGYH